MKYLFSSLLNFLLRLEMIAEVVCRLDPKLLRFASGSPDSLEGSLRPSISRPIKIVAKTLNSLGAKGNLFMDFYNGKSNYRLVWDEQLFRTIPEFQKLILAHQKLA